MRPIPALLCLSYFAAVTPAQQAIPLANPGFEADFAHPNTWSIVIPSGWTLYDPSFIVDQNPDSVGVLNPAGSTYFPAGAPEGSNVCLLFFSGDIGMGAAGVQQTLAHQVLANTRYELQVQVGNIDSGTAAPPLDIYGYFELRGFPGYAVQLLAGGTVVAQDFNSLAATLGEGQFAPTTVVYASPASGPAVGQPLTVRLLNLNQRWSPIFPGIEVDFDDVRLNYTSCPTVQVVNPTQSQCQGQPVELQVFAAGTGPLTFVWRRDGVLIEDGGGVSGATTATLELDAAALSDGGSYTCTVTNACGSTTSQLELSICAGDYNCDGGIDGTDIEAFFAAWEQGTADINEDGGTDGADVEVFFERWEQGC
jgi:hypothetical protein